MITLFVVAWADLAGLADFVFYGLAQSATVVRKNFVRLGGTG